MKEVLVMSGVMGTMMSKMGANPSGCIVRWVVEHPEVYRDWFHDYFGRW